MNTPLLHLLNAKYGAYVKQQLINPEGEIRLDNCNINGSYEQAQVLTHLKALKGRHNKQLIPNHFFSQDIKWGFDFSGWIGPLDHTKQIMLIGAEPNINKNYQIVYDFGMREGQTVQEAALAHYHTKWTKTTRDIWNILASLFLDDLTENHIVHLLSSCYMTDLCHFVPQGCSQVKAIANKLQITNREWTQLRTQVAQLYLRKEIELLNPALILLHGSAARDFFQKVFSVAFDESHIITGSKYTIKKDYLGERLVISIPHLSGDVKNKLWRCHSKPERFKQAKDIMRSLLSIESVLTN